MKIGLAFSGGKDSWAALLLNQDSLSEITVLWVNTGKNYPEALASIDKARSMCPHFVEVSADRDAQNAYEGIPSDVVPINWTRLGQSITGAKPVLIQSYLGCCYQNISWPLHAKAKELGITHMIRGQRAEEHHKSTGVHGSSFDGITYWHPIETWTTAQVMAYLHQKMDVPPHFAIGHSSLDCYDCTAFRQQSTDRIAYTKKNHPALYDAYKARADALANALQLEAV